MSAETFGLLCLYAGCFVMAAIGASLALLGGAGTFVDLYSEGEGGVDPAGPAAFLIGAGLIAITAFLAPGVVVFVAFCFGASIFLSLVSHFR